MRCFQRERRGASIECVLQKPSFFLDHQSTKTNPIIYCLSNIKQLLENHIPTEVAVPLIKECPVVQTLSHRVIQQRTSISTTLLHPTPRIALSDVRAFVCDEEDEEVDEEVDQISTFSNIYRHTSPMLTLYHVIPSSASFY